LPFKRKDKDKKDNEIVVGVQPMKRSEEQASEGGSFENPVV
jgi:hypothetical protein